MKKYKFTRLVQIDLFIIVIGLILYFLLKSIWSLEWFILTEGVLFGIFLTDYQYYIWYKMKIKVIYNEY